MISKIRSIKLVDIFILQQIIVAIAFADFKYLNIISSLVALSGVFLTYLKQNLKNNTIQFLAVKMLFIVLGFLSTLWSINPSNTFYYSVSLIMRLMISISIICYIVDEKNENIFLKVLVFATLVLCIRLLIVVPFSQFGVARIGNYLAHDEDSSYGNTQLTYIFGITSAVLFFDDNKIVKNKFLRYLLLLAFISFSLLSGSRKQVFFIIIVVFVLMLCKSKNILSFFKNLLFTSFILVIAYLMIINVSYLYNIIGSRMEDFLNIFDDVQEVDISTGHRLLFIDQAINVFKNNPILGVGLDGFRFKNEIMNCWAENNYLELLADVGIVGLVLYYIPHLIIIYYLIKNRKHHLSGRYCMILSILLIVLFIDITMVSYRNLVLQFFLGMLFAMASRTNNDLKMTDKSFCELF